MSIGKQTYHLTNFFFMGTSVSNSVGKTEPQVMANLIKLKVIQIQLDHHGMLFKGLQTITLQSIEDTFVTGLWNIILTTFLYKTLMMNIASLLATVPVTHS